MRTAVIGVVVAAGIGVIGFATTTGNIFGTTGAGRVVAPIGVNDIKPPECRDITVTNRILGSGTLRGTADNDLILGEDQTDSLSGQGGDDCLAGGDGDDSFNGGTGLDVCVGGPGNDTFNNTCETQVQ